MKRVLSISLIVVLLGGTSLWAQAKDVLPYDALVRSAKIYLGQKNKDFDKAEEMLRTAVANYPDPVEAHFYLGLIHAERARYADMMAEFKKFEEICARAAETGDKKLQKRCEKDKMQKQIQDTRMAELKRNFDQGVSQLRLADSLKDGLNTLTDPAAAAKDSSLLAQLLAKAKGIFSDCVIIDDTVAGIWTNLALVEERLGNPQEAVKHYERSYQLNPKDARMVYDLANVCFELKDYEKAARFYGEFGDLDEANAEAAYTNQAMCYQSLGDYDRLQAALDKILVRNPNNTDIRYQRGVLNVRNATSAAIRDSAAVLDSLLALRPNDKALKAAQDELMKHRQSFNEKAYEDFKFAAETTKNDPTYWYWYGNISFFLQKQNEALEAYKKCVEFDDANKDCWGQLAIIYARLGMRAEAEQAEAKAK
ncbi:MAG: tetratricopeptide repeat protein [candidate division Zixibacteria bacterium]|nr:tetratricopeptide repeat protein [candidate division Zixibacteria bacterium]